MLDKKYKPSRIIYLIIACGIELFWIFGSIQAISTGLYPAYFTIYYIIMGLAIAAWIYHLSIPIGLRAVAHKLSYKELCSTIEKEKMKKIDLSSFSNGWIPSDLYVSEHWLYMGETYIPRKMASHLSGMKRKKDSAVYINTVNGKEFEIAQMDHAAIKRFLKLLKKHIPELTCTEHTLYEPEPVTFLSKKEWKKLSKEDFHKKYL